MGTGKSMRLEERVDSMGPGLRKSRANKNGPGRAMDRAEGREPSATRSVTAGGMPDRAIPATDNADDSCEKDFDDRTRSGRKESRANMFGSRRVRLLTSKRLPSASMSSANTT